MMIEFDDDDMGSPRVNIATCETSQAITPYHFCHCSNFFRFYHFFTSKHFKKLILSLDEVYDMVHFKSRVAQIERRSP